MSSRSVLSVICVNYAVVVDNLKFCYNNKTNVLQNCCLQVKKGEIFALLGSNGCGKTTLLKLILGRSKPKSGTIKVFGLNAGDKQLGIPGPTAGFMPQEIALNSQLTIEENIRFFAKLFQINSKQFQKCFRHLTQLLNLSQMNKRIDELSGGQQRLVSMAVAIIHKPKLIILDEPTVGVDPIIRTRIWSYLEYMCQEKGNTVIITTHYIEEAKRASTVAFMKSGAILRQSNPQNLLDEYQCETLEAVYIQLWHSKEKQTSIKSNITSESNQVLTVPEFEAIPKFSVERNSLFISRILALIWKFYLRTKGLPLFTLCFIAIPFVSLFSLYLAVGQVPHNIPVAVHSEETEPLLSQQFIDSIDDNFLDVIQYETKVSAIDSIIEGKNTFGIFFNKNFTEKFKTRLLSPFETSDEKEDSSMIRLYTDNTRIVTLTYGLQYLVQVFQMFVSNVSDSLDLHSNAFSLPLTIEQPIYGIHPLSQEFRINYDYLAPAFMMITFHLSAMIFAGFDIVLNRADSQFTRYFMSGGKPIEILISIFISILFYIIIQLLLLLICCSYLFDIKQEGSYIEVFLICFLQSIQGLSIGILISIPFKQEFAIGVTAAALMLPLYFLSGIFWPLEGIPSYFRVLADWTPISKPIDSLRSIMLRGWDYTHPNVFIGYAVSLSYTLIVNIFSIILFQVHQEPFI